MHILVIRTATAKDFLSNSVAIPSEDFNLFFLSALFLADYETLFVKLNYDKLGNKTFFKSQFQQL